MSSSSKMTTNDEPMLLDYCALSRAEMMRLAQGTPEDRAKAMAPVSKVTSAQVLAKEPMTLLDELACILFLGFGVPNGAFTIPLLTFLTGKFILGSVSRAFTGLGILMIPLALLPQPFVPSMLNSWMAVRISKYFSFRMIVEEQPPLLAKTGGKPDTASKHPQICVAPPHGVFPYGNLLAMLTWPTLTGRHFHGLAANMALRVPIFKQILRSIGVVDASRQTARKSLENYPYTIGISTGGVAEVFETNADDECIILKERIGLIKLAIRTGADLVPCYIFGNTKLLSCWGGEGIPKAKTILEKISRKIGFALILIHGRFGLPIPFRIPVLAVLGKPIQTFDIKCEEPTMEQVQKIQVLLIDEMQDIFDRYKELYGWKDKTLIIR